MSPLAPGAPAPRVTVAIPTHNMAEYLPAAVESVLAQSFTDYELLVLDNVSTDDTPAVMARYGDPRLAYRRNEANLGLAGNVNRGCSLARGEYIVFLGADDRWEPDFLKEAVAFLDAEPRVSLVHGPAAWIDRDGRRFGGTGHAWPRLTPGPRAMLGAFGSGFCFSTMLMRTAAIRATGAFDQRWQEVIDLWLFLRMCLVGDIGYLARVLVEYRVHAEAMSMPMYRQNLMFRRQMTAARECFAWPEAVAIGAAGYRRAAERHIARIALEVMHLSRADGRLRYLRNLGEVSRAVPEVLLKPRSWARIGFGMLPAGAMRRLQQVRHRRSVARAVDEQGR
ncbi:glycosyltransferase [Roseomonas sp. OT10]|uniref:glycosyltransferase family 2 protein n=1 Tax=Roseomonas cutis TaxID=2897332 RepID=UPI001E61D450|nr:glycosyltransferase family 2 protein [Roseomonas sp. OT10]UFN49760.1 glycosyltransferase [Roseomonas sp. OT10]